MVRRPSILCPVDFSEASRGALRYAATIAEHFYGNLNVLTVDAPLATTTSESEEEATAETKRRLAEFVNDTLHSYKPEVAELRLDVVVGQPAMEILQLARDRSAGLIVMSTRGVSGPRKALFGSTTERVLRETEVPVLITPAADRGPQCLEDLKDIVQRVLVPVDFTSVTPVQVRIAHGLAEALDASIVIAHVLQPLPSHFADQSLIPQFDAERRVGAERALGELQKVLPKPLHSDVAVVCGEPAEEIARLVRGRDASMIVMGLHASPSGGPRMGSVTYRVLCNAAPLVVALPPRIEDHAWRGSSAAA